MNQQRLLFSMIMALFFIAFSSPFYTGSMLNAGSMINHSTYNATITTPDSLPLFSDTNSLSQPTGCTIECTFSCSTPCGVTPVLISTSPFNRINMPDSYIKAIRTCDIAPPYQESALRPPIA
jgi:hypothetical protein